MAKFTVVWSDFAESQLLDIWIDTRNRKIQLAADAIDVALATGPDLKRNETIRKASHPAHRAA